MQAFVWDVRRRGTARIKAPLRLARVLRLSFPWGASRFLGRHCRAPGACPLRVLSGPLFCVRVWRARCRRARALCWDIPVVPKTNVTSMSFWMALVDSRSVHYIPCGNYRPLISPIDLAQLALGL